MKIGILGSGIVGRTLGTGLIKLGHDVMIGSRDAQKTELKQWVIEHHGKSGTFEETGRFGEMIFLCTAWSGTENAISLAKPENLKHKVVVDVTNPLDFSGGGIPKLAIGHTTSGGETVQSWLPESYVVKAFNIISAIRMTDGEYEDGELDMFIAGNHESGKESVAEIIRSFNWEVHDLGSIEASRILEYFALLWITIGFKSNMWDHAFKLVR